MKAKFFIIGFLSAGIILLAGSAVFAGKEYAKSFSDVNEGDWFYTPIMELNEEGLLNGYPDGSFGSNKYMTRAEVAKLFYLTDLRIAKLEADLTGKANEESVSQNGTDEEEDVVVDDSTGEDATAESSQIVINTTVNLTSASTMPAGYSLFEETTKKFKVFYPSIYFWRNTIGEANKANGYLWITEFSKEDFATEENADVNFIVAVVDPSKINSNREVLIFVKRDATTSFLVAGNTADMQILQKVAASFKTF